MVMARDLVYSFLAVVALLCTAKADLPASLTPLANVAPAVATAEAVADELVGCWIITASFPRIECTFVINACPDTSSIGSNEQCFICNRGNLPFLGSCQHTRTPYLQFRHVQHLITR